MFEDDFGFFFLSSIKFSAQATKLNDYVILELKVVEEHMQNGVIILITMTETSSHYYSR